LYRARVRSRRHRSIGTAIVHELIGRGHEVHGLARSHVSAKKLAELGATPFLGDITSPEQWAGSLPHADAVIHPAMVFEPCGGVFRRFARDARERNAIRVVEGEAVRWPLVHSDDLANLYALALEHAPSRSSYIGAAIEGLAVGRIARALAKRFGTRHREPHLISAEAIAAELGVWAKGFALDQQLSGAKARRELGWTPKHLDPEREIALLA
jgi:nucleoside-diphosphate-sugar epimerase